MAMVALINFREGARRVFSSAPIAKRFDVFTLETVDGICVSIKGFINKQKTTENGFPSEVVLKIGFHSCSFIADCGFHYELLSFEQSSSGKLS